MMIPFITSSTSDIHRDSFQVHKAVRSMEANRFHTVFVVFSCLVATCYGSIAFSSLQRTVIVTASPKTGQVVKAGEDNITISWSFDTTFPSGTDSSYKTVKFKLCYAPVSQKDRGWRKTEDEIKKDKTCQHKIIDRPYARSNNTATWAVLRDVPGATYFIRGYVHDSADHEVAYGQTTDSAKTTNLFVVKAVTGRHMSLDIASVCFSAFSMVSLFGFFYVEKRKGRAAN